MFSSKLKAPRGGKRHLAKLPDHASQSGVAKALLHGNQHVGVASSLDEHDSVWVETCKMQRGCEEVVPVQTPENRALAARQYAREEHGGSGVVGKFDATCNLMQ